MYAHLERCSRCSQSRFLPRNFPPVSTPFPVLTASFRLAWLLPTPLPFLTTSRTRQVGNGPRVSTYPVFKSIFEQGLAPAERGKTFAFHVLGRADASIQCHDQTAFYETWCNKISIRDGRNRTTIASIDDSSSLTRETISHLSSLVTNVHSNFLAKQIPVNKADLVRGAVPLILKTQFIPR